MRQTRLGLDVATAQWLRAVEKAQLRLGACQLAADVDILTVDVVGGGVLHDAGDLSDEAFGIPSPTQKMEAHLLSLIHI